MSGKDVASLIHAKVWIRNENVGEKRCSKSDKKNNIKSWEGLLPAGYGSSGGLWVVGKGERKEKLSASSPGF